MAKAQPGNRLVIQLDPRVALEGVILTRHRQLPANRRQEWLRRLLLQGFGSECQALRGASDETKHAPATAFTNWKADGSQQSVGVPVSETAVVKEKPPQVGADSKPFAALSKVIG
ncbi:MAG: hypothetical protein JAZ17_27720 [Candidatus Thiodiazotropha endolucinida]|nr:hypothetical protein [Candidatus Thiodiazotropha taylori]MCG7953561.1 hypothetical protein [Candidatus Thiodiazotropha taylori]MCG8097361.1 hypothetical protein [Candidatus Thiodiazotropha endolucinida]MCW4268987.1 hypothetical protein [Candidatus Thiodiazotropha endolucinida]MCW4270797.1 hypothetical protein [Candidatus Thiodiazotropha endolucinida]